MTRAVLFDVDGVLIRGNGEGQHWSSYLLRDLHLEPELLHRAFFEKYWQDVIIGLVPLDEALAHTLANIAPWLPATTLMDYWFKHDSKVDDGLIAFIDKLRSSGTFVALATNQEHARMRYILDALDLRRHIDHAFYSAEIGARKPSPIFFEHVSRALKRPVNEIVLIDDSHENIAAAEQAGWKARHWPDGGIALPELERELLSV